MPNLTPCLWFEGKAEEAARFYASIFPNSAVGRIMLFPEGSPGTPGTVMSVDFTLAGKPFLGLNGGPEFKLTPAVSFMIDCETQEEIDHYWEKLLEGGEQMMCGWLTDRYGITWQVFPRILDDLINDPDREKGQRVFTAMLSMVKLDLAALLKAYNGD